jgi:membrane protein
LREGAAVASYEILQRDRAAADRRPVLGAVIAGALALSGVFLARHERRQVEREIEDNRRGRMAAKPTQIPRAGWGDILKRTWEQIGEDNISIVAAGVAFYALLSIFPAFTALVSLYGLVADPVAVQNQIAAAQGFLPAEATKLLADELQALVQGPKTGIGIGLAVSVTLALWSARAGTGALMTALNIAYGEAERRNFIKFNLIAFGLTAGMIVFGIVALLVVAVIPAVLKFLWLPESLGWVITLVRWPVLAAFTMLALAALYRFGPSRAKPQWQWVSVGSAVATALWIVASIGFSIYVSKFGDYNMTYGSLGAIIILLTWFWISSYIFLAGAELNAEMEHQTARDTTTGPERPLGSRGARMADTVAASPGR